MSDERNEKDKDSKLPSSCNVHLQRVLSTAQEELRKLTQERAEVTGRISTVKKTIAGLVNMFGNDILSEELLILLNRKSDRPAGLTNACRTVLMVADQALTGEEIYERLQQRDPQLLLHHREPLTSINAVLNRLLKYGEARTVRVQDQRAWEWVKTST